MSTAPWLFVRAMSAFFTFGALASGFSVATLLLPGGPLDVLWRVNPTGHTALQRTGAPGVILMGLVCVVCAVTAAGLWLRKRWAHGLALAMLGMNLAGDLVNAFLLGDLRTLVGIPVASAMIFALLSPRVRAVFRASTAAL